MAHPHPQIKRISDIHAGDHLCCIYSTEEEHRAVITPFLRAGLEQNEKVFYIVDARTRDVVINYLKNDGVDVDYYLNKGQFSILTIADAYMKSGVFDPDRMIVLLTSETRKALDEGYSALRVTGEMSWALRGLPGSERLIEYENKLNTFLSGSRCLAICQYDRRRFDAGILLDILLTHPFAFIGANLYDNFYYAPREDILKPNQLELTLNRWIKNIMDRKAAEEAFRESEEKYRTVFENTGTAMVVLEESSIISLANEEFAHLSGFSKDDIEGKKSWTEFVVKEDLERMLAQHRLRRQNREKALTHYEFRFVTKSGDIRNIYLSIDIIPGTKKSVASLLDITERKLAEELYQTVFKNMGTAMIILEEDTTISHVNEEMENIWGYSKEEIEGQVKWPKLVAEEDLEKMLEYHRLRRNDPDSAPRNYEFRFVHKDGGLRDAALTAAMIPGTKKSMISLRDITEFKKTEHALRESEERFRRISSLISNFSFSCKKTMDSGYVIDWMSGAVEQITGFSVEEIKARLCWRYLVIEGDLPVFDKNVTGLLPGESAQCELRIRHKTGRVVWLDAFSECIPEINDPDCHRLYGACRDITDRKMMEDEIRSLNTALEQRIEQRTAQLTTSLEDKEVLLREVHHRVKNNLQIIISLLNLQSRYITDEMTLAAIKESQNRVRAMALVHEKLYQSADIAKINLDDYVRFLGNSLFQFYGMKGKGIVLTTRIQDINVGINTAIPIGLIVNELVSNSLKHAFPDGRKGEISFAITRENAMLNLVYKDNGTGIPAELDWHNAKSLGLRLVISLVEQLQGTIELERTAGTAFKIIVKEKE
jgi:PAS domain S-box-containing protein